MSDKKPDNTYEINTPDPPWRDSRCRRHGSCTICANPSQTTGEPGSPGATTTIDGKQLPPPDPTFGGVIKEKATESKPWWPPRIVPPKEAPNILLVMTDDWGFGAPGTFGGVVPTPALDRIAKNGLRYTQFHSTSLCSPTRAALITGRNHHVEGFGVVGESVRDSRDTTRLLSGSAERLVRFSRRTGTRPRGSARITTRRSIKRARLGRSISGRPAWVSTISTGSSVATPASGSRTCFATRRPFTRFKDSPAGI